MTALALTGGAWKSPARRFHDEPTGMLPMRYRLQWQVTPTCELTRETPGVPIGLHVGVASPIVPRVGAWISRFATGPAWAIRPSATQRAPRRVTESVTRSGRRLFEARPRDSIRAVVVPAGTTTAKPARSHPIPVVRDPPIRRPLGFPAGR